MLVYFCQYCDYLSLAERVEEPWILLAELEDTGLLFKGLVSQIRVGVETGSDEKWMKNAFLSPCTIK